MLVVWLGGTTLLHSSTPIQRDKITRQIQRNHQENKNNKYTSPIGRYSTCECSKNRVSELQLTLVQRRKISSVTALKRTKYSVRQNDGNCGSTNQLQRTRPAMVYPRDSVENASHAFNQLSDTTGEWSWRVYQCQTKIVWFVWIPSIYLSSERRLSDLTSDFLLTS